MPGRVVHHYNAADIRSAFSLGAEPAEIEASYNAAPSREIPVIREINGERRIDGLVWGLIPSWARDLIKTKPQINARSESVFEKATFKDSILSRRCILPVSGYYEWKPVRGKGKIPLLIHPKKDNFFAMAGIWDAWKAPSGNVLTTFAVLTTEPNAFIKPIHHRMAVILKPEAWDGWLNPAMDDEKEIKNYFREYPSKLMAAYPVSNKVNKPENNYPELLDEVRVTGKVQNDLFS